MRGHGDKRRGSNKLQQKRKKRKVQKIVQREKATTDVDDDSARSEKGGWGRKSERRVRSRTKGRRGTADSWSRNGSVLPAW